MPKLSFCMLMSEDDNKMIGCNDKTRDCFDIFPGDRRSASERIIELVRCCPAGGSNEEMLYTQIDAMLSQLGRSSGSGALPDNKGALAPARVRDSLLSEDLRQECHTLQETVLALKQQREASQHLIRELRARCSDRERQVRELGSLLAAAELAKDCLLLDQCSLTNWSISATPTADRYAERAHTIARAESEREAARERERELNYQLDTLKMKVTSLEQADAQHVQDRRVLQATAGKQAGEVKRLQALLDEALENLATERSRTSAAQSCVQKADLELKVLRSLHISGK